VKNTESKVNICAFTSANKVPIKMNCSRLVKWRNFPRELSPIRRNVCCRSAQNAYYKALIANAAINALRLHQRLGRVRLSREFLAELLMEDSCHYLFYSMIFLYVAPLTRILS
jgi:N-glycosylase/DNA lyase